MGDLFLSLEGVEGESLDFKYAGMIEIHDLKWGLENKAPPRIGQAEASKQTSADHLVIEKWVDNASVTLTRMCANGQNIPNGKIICRKNHGEKKIDYLTIELFDVKIDKVNWGGRGDETKGINETVQFSFHSFRI